MGWTRSDEGRSHARDYRGRALYTKAGPDHGPATPDDPRSNLPLSERAYTQELLPDGTVVTSYEDEPLVPTKAALELPEVDLDSLGAMLKGRGRPPKAPRDDDRWARWRSNDSRKV